MPNSKFRTEVRESDAAAVEQLVRTTGVFSNAEIAIARELVDENLAQGGQASGYHFLFADGPVELQGYTCFGPISGIVVDTNSIGLLLILERAAVGLANN